MNLAQSTAETLPAPALQSCTYTPKKADNRCRAWAKRWAGAAHVCDNARPAYVDGANDLPGDYLAFGREIELFPGDVVFEGEENHHSKQRGWSYAVGVVVAIDGTDQARIVWLSKDERDAAKSAWKAAGEKAWVAGAGEVASLLRGAGAVLTGLLFPVTELGSQTPSPDGASSVPMTGVSTRAA